MAIETMASFLPMDRRQTIARGTSMPEHLHGAALFADVSGFTSLTELLVERHGLRRGAEELTVRLNRVYDVLIAEVDRVGGSVIGFSGDAITCWFDAGGARGEDDDIQAAAGRAVAGAGGMRAGLATLRDGDPSLGLDVKVAIATGPARRFVVGDPSVQLLDALAGETLARMAAVERLASVGEILVDEQTVAAAPCACADVEWREDPATGAKAAVLRSTQPEGAPAPWPDLDARAVPDEVWRRWVLPGVNPAHGDFVTDLRQTVPLFLAFTGIDYDADPRAGERLDGLVRWVQLVLGRHDASLLDITIGDKGSYLYASFGAPVAHENDAARAARAALELCVPPPELSFVRDVRIGISQGTMRAGVVGGPTRRTYAVLGDEVNLAARLMQRAQPGEVLASGRVHEVLGDDVASELLAVVEVKGRQALVPVYRLERAAARAETRSRLGAPLVGRAEELAVLDRALDGLLEGESGFVVLEGEPGLGKSRLVQELRDRTVGRGATSLVGAGDPVGQATLFHGWRPVFRSIFGFEDAPADDAVVPGVLARLAELTGDPDAPDYAPLLAPVLPLRLPDGEATAGLTGQIRADRRLALMVDVLRGVASAQPLVLVLEDAHWLDTSSWALVQRVAREVTPILLVCATRPPDSPAPELAELLADSSTTRVALEPLDAGDLREVVRLRLGVDVLPEQVASLVADKAEGNPFFGEELTSALRDTGVIEVSEGACTMVATQAELRELSLPDTVQGVITSRIDRLTDPQKLAVKFASVIGRSFRLRTLQEIHPLPDYARRLHEDLDVLAQLDLTPLETVEPEPTFVFKHAITQEVAYNMVLFEHRAKLHRAVAEWFERTLADNLAPYYATLAHHLGRALEAGAIDPETRERALDYGFKAGEQGLRNNAHVEATDQFRQVIELLPATDEGTERDRREFLAQTMLGYALMNQRGYGDPEVEAAYRRAHELTGTATASAEAGPPLYGLLSYYASRGEYEPAGQVAGELLALGDELDDPQVRLIGHNSVGLVSILRGELETGREHTEKSYRLADAHQDQAFVLRYGGDFRGYPRVWLSTAECLLGFPDRALRTFAETLELTREHPYTYGFMLTFGITPILRADLEHTLACAEQLTDVAQRYGFVLLQLVANIHKGWALTMQGQENGVELISGSLPVIKAVKLDSFAPMYLGLQAEAQLASGQLDDAAASLAEADAYVTASGRSFYAAELARLRARLRELEGDWSHAADDLRRAIATAREQGARWWELRATTALAALGLSDEQRTEAQGLLARIVQSFEEGEATADLLAARTALEPSTAPDLPQERR